MSPAFAGAIATALAVTCLILIPLGSPRMWQASLTHPELSVLREAGWTRSLLTWEYLRGIAIICGLALGNSVGTPLLGLIGAVAPSIVARTLAARRREERARPGASLTEALRLASASERETPFGPFAAALRAFDLGAPLDVAFRAARARARDYQVILGLDALSLCVAEQLPASRCATLIASTVDRLVFEQRIADDVRARTSGLRVQIVLLAALVPGLALYLALTVPGMAETLTAPLGRFVLLPLAATLEVIGILASRRVVGDIT